MKNKKKLIIKNNKILIEDATDDPKKLLNVMGLEAVKDLAVDTVKFVAFFSNLVVKIGWAGVRYKVFGNLDLKEFKNAINKSNLNFTRQSNRSIDSMNSTTQNLLRSAGYGDSFDKLLSVGMPATFVLDALGKIDTNDLFRERFKDTDELKIDVKNFSVGIAQSMLSIIGSDAKDVQNFKIPPSLTEAIKVWLNDNIHMKFYDKIDSILKSEQKKETKKIIDLVNKLKKQKYSENMESGEIRSFINFLIEQIASSKIVENRAVLFLRNTEILNEASYASDANIQSNIKTLCKLIAITIMYDSEKIRNIVISIALGDIKDITQSDQNEIHKKLSSMALEAVAIVSQVNFCEELLDNRENNDANIVSLSDAAFDREFNQIKEHVHEDIVSAFNEFRSDYKNKIKTIDENKNKLDPEALSEMIELLIKNVDDYLSQDLTLDSWSEYANLVKKSLNENYLTASVKALIAYNQRSNNKTIKEKNDENKRKNNKPRTAQKPGDDKESSTDSASSSSSEDTDDSTST